MKRPRDMTRNELEALPEGPLARVFTPFTEEDYANGAVGKGRTHAYILPVIRHAYEPEDIVRFTDRSGAVWGFGQFEDGTWFKSYIGGI